MEFTDQSVLVLLPWKRYSWQWDGAMAVELGQTEKILLCRHTDAAFQGCFHQFCMEPATVCALTANTVQLSVSK